MAIWFVTCYACTRGHDRLLKNPLDAMQMLCGGVGTSFFQRPIILNEGQIAAVSNRMGNMLQLVSLRAVRTPGTSSISGLQREIALGNPKAGMVPGGDI